MVILYTQMVLRVVGNCNLEKVTAVEALCLVVVKEVVVAASSAVAAAAVLLL